MSAKSSPTAIPRGTVTWKITDGLHAWCDPSLARIVLENLLGNAWKFTAKIENPRIEFDVVPNTQAQHVRRSRQRRGL